MLMRRWRSSAAEFRKRVGRQRGGVSGVGAQRASGPRPGRDAGARTAAPDGHDDDSAVWQAILAAQWEAQARRGAGDGPHASVGKVLDDDLEFMRGALSGYEILERVRYGGQGIVYRARHRMTNRITAIKVLLDGPLATRRQLARFDREAELTSRLQHPHIVTLYDYGVVRGRPYLATQYVEGLPINEHVVLHDLPPRAVVALFATVCRAVGHAHQQGIIHRDLSPSNILVDATGQPHILDLGLAKDLYEERPAGACSTRGHVVGTLPYLSPEQAAGAGGVDARSDIYSLGVVLYELLTDVLPYPVDGDAQQVRGTILTAEPLALRQAAAAGDRDRLPRPDAITRDLESVVHKAIAKDKTERYQSVTALADDLERYLRGEPVEARAGHRFYLLRKALRRHRLAATVAALLLFILVIASGAIGVALVYARAQRDNARATAAVAHSALSDVLHEIELDIRTLAGGIAVRDRLVHRVAGHLQRLRPLAEADTALWNVLAALREKQGDLAHAQGRDREAAEHYLAAIDVLVPHAGAPAPSFGVLAQTARLHRKLAPLSDDPAAHFCHAVSLGEWLMRDQPDADDARYELCCARVAAGLHFHNTGHPERAVEQIDAALELAAAATPADADRVRWDDLLATAQATRGSLDMRLGRPQSAVTRLELAIRLRERLVAARPADVVLRHTLFASFMNLGHLERDRGRRADAAGAYRQALELGEYLTSADPGAAVWVRDLCVAHDTLARLLLADGLIDEAQCHCDRAAELAARLVETEPGHTEYQRVLGFSHKLQGQIHAARSEWRLARQSYERARMIRAALCSEAPENLEDQANLAEVHDWLGKCCRALGESTSALAHYRAAYEIRTALLRAQPNVTQRAVDVVLSQTKLATWHLDRNSIDDDRAAAQLLGEAEATLVRLGDSGQIFLESGKYRDWLQAIAANEELIERRGTARLREDQATTPECAPPQGSAVLGR